MNREILFRGKRIDNGEWVYGSLIIDHSFLLEKNIYSIRVISKHYNENHRINEKTVGQFTGLTDKNGNKIFEGDIVEIPDYSQGIALTYKQPTKNVIAEYRKGWKLTTGIDFKGVIITGNIHDNDKI